MTVAVTHNCKALGVRLCDYNKNEPGDLLLLPVTPSRFIRKGHCPVFCEVKVLQSSALASGHFGTFDEDPLRTSQKQMCCICTDCF